MITLFQGSIDWGKSWAEADRCSEHWSPSVEGIHKTLSSLCKNKTNWIAIVIKRDLLMCEQFGLIGQRWLILPALPRQPLFCLPCARFARGSGLSLQPLRRVLRRIGLLLGGCALVASFLANRPDLSRLLASGHRSDDDHFNCLLVCCAKNTEIMQRFQWLAFVLRPSLKNVNNSNRYNPLRPSMTLSRRLWWHLSGVCVTSVVKSRSDLINDNFV